MNPDASAARLAAIVQSSGDAIVSKTLDGIIMSWNPAAERMFGYTAAEAIGQPITLIIPPERHFEEHDVLTRVRRGEAVEHFQTERRHKNGRPVRISLSVSPIVAEDGRIIGASKIARDITELHVADETRARLAAIVDSSDDAIVGKTIAGIINSWNPAAERMFGYTAAEAIGQPITLIIPPERHAEEHDVLRRIGRGERVDHFETVRVTKQGRTVPVSVTVSPVRNANGAIIGASKIARDISLLKRAEAERAALLAREQAAREEAESLNRAKDEFLATLSHELRTPINAIYGWTRMLQASRVDPAVMERAVDAIVRNATAQVQLVDDVLDVSRIITGNMRLDVRSVDLKSVLEAALDAVRPAAAAKQIRIDTVLDPRAGPITGDPDRLRQVAWNLLINAVKFTAKGGRVQLQLQRVNSHVEIVVSDTGEGILPDVLPYVFDRFRQGDGSITRRHGGLGLGLALVRHLVDLHGGSVSAHSEGRDKGATFVVKLPIALARIEAASAREHPTAPPIDGRPPIEAPSLAGIRVLVVDDDLDGLELIGVIMTEAGAETKTCRSAAAARETLAGWRPDVLISDIEMPGEDGYSFIRTLQAASPGDKIPSVALTAYGRPEDRMRALAAGFRFHVTKPVDPAELTLVVANLAAR